MTKLGREEGGVVANNSTIVNTALKIATRGSGLRLRESKLKISDNPTDFSGTDGGVGSLKVKGNHPDN